jgi:tetratricopeptide (TPR) repeat protein
MAKSERPIRAPTEAEAPPSSEGPASLWRELKDRKVIRASAVYAAVAWGVVIGAADLTDILELPSWVPKVILVVAVLGFPVAAVLAWAFELTPKGLTKATPFVDPKTQRRSRQPFLAGLVVGLASVGLLAYLVPGDGERVPRTEWDSDVVAILPFQYSGPPGLDYLGDGVFQLLTSRFTGEVGPRSTDAAATASLWARASAADPLEAATQVAGRLGAGLVVSGTVLAGPDERLTLSASLRDAATGVDVATSNASGPLDSLNAAVDRLANGLLSQSVGFTEGLNQITTADPSALGQYLRGWSDFRNGRWGQDSYEHFARAVEIDSTFALAWIWLADVGVNAIRQVVPTNEALERAWHHRGRLSERERLYLQARLGPNYPDPATREERQRSYLAAARVNPGRANLWYFLGDNIVHAPEDASSYDEALRYFERAVELDPRNANALLHVEIAHILRRDLDGAITGAEQLAALDTTGSAARHVEWLRAVRDGDRESAAVRYGSLEDFNDLELYFGDTPVLLRWEWQIEEITQALDRLQENLILGSLVPAEQLYLFHAYQDLGRPQRALEALRQLEEAENAVRHRMRLLHGLYGALPEDVARASALELEARLDSLDSYRDDGTTALTAAADRFTLELWRISTGDVGDVGEAVRYLRGLRPGGAEVHQITLEVMALLLEAVDRTLRGSTDPRALLDTMDALSRQGIDVGPGVYDAIVLTTSAAYERLGDLTNAERVLERESKLWTGGTPYNARFARERGRLASLNGDTARAIREYEFYLLLRSSPAPELQAEAEDVRDALQVLTGS